MSARIDLIRNDIDYLTTNFTPCLFINQKYRNIYLCLFLLKPEFSLQLSYCLCENSFPSSQFCFRFSSSFPVNGASYRPARRNSDGFVFRTP